MPLHRLTGFTMGVPNVEETAGYFTDFGLFPSDGATPAEARFSTLDGGEQLSLVPRPTRQLVRLGIGADDADDLARIASSLQRLDLPARLDGDELETIEPVTGATVTVTIAPHLKEAYTSAPRPDAPGDAQRTDARAPAVYRTDRVHPRKLGHVVLGTVDHTATQRFFLEGLGFRISDGVGSAIFMRCSTDHHNVVAFQAPMNFLQHSAWEVDDVDEIGRGAASMLEGHPERPGWGLGRHAIGSNFFYYLGDPSSGVFSEYYSDLDYIVDDEAWEATVIPESATITEWGPSQPPSFTDPPGLI